MYSEESSFGKLQDQLAAALPQDPIVHSHEEVLDSNTEDYRRRAENIGTLEEIQKAEANIAQIKQDLAKNERGAHLFRDAMIGFTNFAMVFFGTSEVLTIVNEDTPDRAYKTGLFGAGLIICTAENVFLRSLRKKLNNDQSPQTA